MLLVLQLFSVYCWCSVADSDVSQECCSCCSVAVVVFLVDVLYWRCVITGVAVTNMLLLVLFY